MLQEWKDIIGLILQLINLIVLIYGGYKFFRKPHDTLAQKHEELVKRVDKQDIRLDDIEESLLKGNDRFRNQEETTTEGK